MGGMGAYEGPSVFIMDCKLWKPSPDMYELEVDMPMM